MYVSLTNIVKVHAGISVVYVDLLGHSITLSLLFYSLFFSVIKIVLHDLQALHLTQNCCGCCRAINTTTDWY